MTIIKTIRENIKNRPDSEFEQALIRLAIISGVLSFALLSDHSEFNKPLIINIALTSLLIGLLLLSSIIYSSKKSVPRRVIGIIVDIGACSIGVFYGGEWAYSFFWVFVFILIGNGFRFGSAYTYFVAALSLLGIGLSWHFSPYWTFSNAMSVGLMVGIMMITIYLGALLNRLQKLVEEVKKANDAKGQFLANVSHEIKTPMNGILGMLDIVQRQDLPEKTRSQVSMAQHSAESLLVLMNDILDFSKIESGKIIIENKTFSIYDLASEVVELSRASAVAKNLNIDFKIFEQVPEYVKGDVFKLRQVILNLLSNAIKFTETGEVKLIIDSQTKFDSIELLCSVIDTGIGIDDETQKRIFEQFEQADASTTRKFGGTGLGLPISKGIIEAMHGVLSVKSTLLVGSIFEFTAILKKADLQPPEQADSFVNSEKNITENHSMPLLDKKIKVLLVEDNVINQEIARTMLERMGCNVDISGDGRQVIEYFTTHSNHDVDIIFMDCQMPYMDGYETTESLKLIWESHPNATIPIVALTASSMPGDKKRCISVGMDDYIAKPVSYDSLLATLVKWLPEKNIEFSRSTSQHHIDEPHPITNKTIIDVLFDSNVLLQMHDMLGDRYLPMVEEFEKKSNTIIMKMQSQDKSDGKIISDLSHDLRGCSAAFGAKKLSRLCQTLENQVTIHDSIEKIDKTINKISHLNMMTIDQLQKI